MLKFLAGIVVMIALVGYGVITTDDVEGWGDKLVDGVNSVATSVKEATDKTAMEQAQEAINERLK